MGPVDGEDAQDVEEDGAHGEPQADQVHLPPAGEDLVLPPVREEQQRQEDGGKELRRQRPPDHDPHPLFFSFQEQQEQNGVGLFYHNFPKKNSKK